MLFISLKVKFVGEDGFDVGGLSREFFTLILEEMRKTYWMNGTLIRNAKALKVNFGLLSIILPKSL